MKKLIPLPLLIVFFVACTSGTDQSVNKIDADMVLDNQIFLEATGTNNIERCEQISNEAQKNECKMIVKSFLITQNAVDKLDKTLCDEIEDERYKENCESSVDIMIEDAEAQEKLAEEEMKKNEELQAIQTQAVNEGNADICDQIEDESQKYSCMYNVIANQAISSKDPSLCEEIENESTVEQCKYVVEQSMN